MRQGADDYSGVRFQAKLSQKAARVERETSEPCVMGRPLKFEFLLRTVNWKRCKSFAKNLPGIVLPITPRSRTPSGRVLI